MKGEWHPSPLLWFEGCQMKLLWWLSPCLLRPSGVSWKRSTRAGAKRSQLCRSDLTLKKKYSCSTTAGFQTLEVGSNSSRKCYHTGSKWLGAPGRSRWSSVGSAHRGNENSLGTQNRPGHFNVKKFSATTATITGWCSFCVTRMDISCSYDLWPYHFANNVWVSFACLRRSGLKILHVFSFLAVGENLLGCCCLVVTSCAVTYCRGGMMQTSYLQVSGERPRRQSNGNVEWTHWIIAYFWISPMWFPGKFLLRTCWKHSISIGQNRQYLLISCDTLCRAHWLHEVVLLGDSDECEDQLASCRFPFPPRSSNINVTYLAIQLLYIVAQAYAFWCLISSWSIKNIWFATPKSNLEMDVFVGLIFVNSLALWHLSELCSSYKTYVCDDQLPTRQENCRECSMFWTQLQKSGRFLVATHSSRCVLWFHGVAELYHRWTYIYYLSLLLQSFTQCRTCHSGHFLELNGCQKSANLRTAELLRSFSEAVEVGIVMDPEPKDVWWHQNLACFSCTFLYLFAFFGFNSCVAAIGFHYFFYPATHWLPQMIPAGSFAGIRMGQLNLAAESHHHAARL